MIEMFLLFIAVFLPILTLVDLSKEGLNKQTTIIWAVIIVSIPLVGPVSYLIWSRYRYWRGMIDS